jgi:hypothetical protein
LDTAPSLPLYKQEAMRFVPSRVERFSVHMPMSLRACVVVLCLLSPVTHLRRADHWVFSNSMRHADQPQGVVLTQEPGEACSRSGCSRGCCVVWCGVCVCAWASLPSTARHPDCAHLADGTIQIRELPAEIATLTSLEVLSVAGNSITSIPPEIGALCSLREAYFGGNPVRSCTGQAHVKKWVREVAALSHVSCLVLVCCVVCSSRNFHHLWRAGRCCKRRPFEPPS